VAGEETEVVIKQEGDGDDDDSSSEETVEDSEENRRRRREVNTDNTPLGRAVILSRSPNCQSGGLDRVLWPASQTREKLHSSAHSWPNFC